MSKKDIQNDDLLVPISLVKNKLKLGEAITYKDLCTKLDIPYYSSGNQKKAQLKELQRCFEFENANRKLIITKIYDEALPKIRNVAANAVYVKYVECILLSQLAKQPDNKIYMTNQQLYYLLGMVNEKFIKYAKNYKLLEDKDNNLTHIDIKEFYERCNANLPDILNSSLNSLVRRVLIEHDKVYMIGIKNSDGEIIYHEASDDERSEILKVKREVMTEFGVEIEIQIYLQGKKEKYYEKLNEKFIEEYEWYNVYQTNKIIYCQKTAIQALPADKEKFQKLMLNNEVVNKFNKQTDKIYQSKKEDQDMLELLFDSIYEYNDPELVCATENTIKNDEASQYLRKQYYLTDTLIKLN